MNVRGRTCLNVFHLNAVLEKNPDGSDGARQSGAFVIPAALEKCEILLDGSRLNPTHNGLGAQMANQKFFELLQIVLVGRACVRRKIALDPEELVELVHG
jgi:hypothetical protein